MATKRYEVDFHLICVLYFSDGVPSGPDLAELWTALAALGSYKTDVSMKSTGDTEIANMRNCVLGASVLSERLESVRHIDLVGGSIARPDAANAVDDSDINFSFKRNSIWDGELAPSRLELSISGQVIERAGSDVVLNVIQHFFDVGDRSAPIYGFVDLSKPRDTYAGMVYGTAWPRAAPLARWVEHMSWMYSAAQKGDRVRGIYWGNYFGAKILDKLGGRDTFLETCAKNARNFDGTPNAHHWNLPNGVFVSLSFDPLDCRPGHPFGLHPVAENNLKWLVRECGERGVLNHW